MTLPLCFVLFLFFSTTWRANRKAACSNNAAALLIDCGALEPPPSLGPDDPLNRRQLRPDQRPDLGFRPASRPRLALNGWLRALARTLMNKYVAG